MQLHETIDSTVAYNLDSLLYQKGCEIPNDAGW